VTTTSAGRLLRQARRGQALTQRDLSRRTHIAQPAIATVESGAHVPSVDRLDGLVARAGHRLAVLPTRSSTASDVADAVYEALRAGQPRRARRLLVQLNDDLAAEHGVVRAALAATPPAPTGDTRYDAYVAALVEHHLVAEHLPIPAWVEEPSRILDEPWIVDRFAEPDVESTTPPAFRRHGVLVDAVELASV
jgi:transcriptional regulator with XRE-family HTH domain